MFNKKNSLEIKAFESETKKKSRYTLSKLIFLCK